MGKTPERRPQKHEVHDSGLEIRACGKTKLTHIWQDKNASCSVMVLNLHKPQMDLQMSLALE